jgi:hypothetical protein
MSRAGYGSVVGPFRFSQGSQFGKLQMMLYVMCLEIYCGLSVAEIGIVACASRTDVASGKEGANTNFQRGIAKSHTAQWSRFNRYEQLRA